MISRRELALELESAKPWRDGEEMLRYIEAEGWLRNPDEAPGRTITVGEFERAWADSVDQDDRKQYRDFLALLGIAVAPDPEPTNAELLVEDLAGIYGANLTWTAKIAISEALAERGWVKAPGGDDER